MKIKLLTSILALSAFAASASATIVFTEDFQTPDVTGYDEGARPSTWVQGFSSYGSNRHGLIDEDSGDFNGQSTPLVDDGEQAYAFRYTSSPAIVTTEAAISATIVDGQNITVTFDAVEDLGDNEGSAFKYDVYLFAIESGSTRLNSWGGTGWTELANLTGSVAAGTTWTTGLTLSYTVGGGDSAVFGDNIAVGFKDSWTGSGGESSALFDNVSVDVTPVPEPSAFALLAGCFGLAWVMLRRRG